MIVACVHAENQERRVVGLRSETSQALRYRSPVPAEFHDVTGDPFGYWRVLRELWARCEDERHDLILVEHDIVVRRSAFDSLELCSNPWCGFPYELAGGTQMALGFTRFRLELIEDVPGAIELAGSDVEDGMPPRHWVRMDTRLDRVLRERGYEPCEHAPAVRHLNERQREVRIG